ncbi:MAG: aldehyde dehydrogenase family protein [Bacteroidia bacterium]|nr:aldehyde dehydrogenase family protein [Bacteroidia bacterium]
MQVINPANGSVITTLTEDTAASAAKKYETAKAAQPAWAARSVAERVAILEKFYHSLEADIQSLAATLTSEVGKPLGQSRGEVNGARNRIRFFLDNSEKWLKAETTFETEGLREVISFEPLGVIGNISAWNYPYLVGVNVFVPALIAGNAVLYKPSEFATLTGIEIGKHLHAAGVPAEIFQLVIGGKEAGQALLDLPLDGYFFTGSYATGKFIYEAVAPKMVPCQLELGGKDPLYISADNSNLAKVANAGVEGAFYNNGQSCCAVERIYVHENLYDAYLEKFMEEFDQMIKTGDPTEEGVFIGPLTREAQIQVLEDQVQDALKKGARLLAGGKRMNRPGYYFEPTVLVDVDHTMKVMMDESFGPVIGIQKVGSDDEAVKLMLDTEYGLTSAVYADHEENATPILEKMNSGTVYWNACDRVSPHVPWSGRGHSGIGATLSYLGIRAFTKPKAWHLRK